MMPATAKKLSGFCSQLGCWNGRPAALSSQLTTPRCQSNSQVHTVIAATTGMSPASSQRGGDRVEGPVQAREGRRCGGVATHGAGGGSGSRVFIVVMGVLLSALSLVE